MRVRGSTIYDNCMWYTWYHRRDLDVQLDEGLSGESWDSLLERTVHLGGFQKNRPEVVCNESFCNEKEVGQDSKISTATRSEISFPRI